MISEKTESCPEVYTLKNILEFINYSKKAKYTRA
jgi:hypothetical protein